MGTQSFLNLGDICHIYFRDNGYFFKIIKGIWEVGPLSNNSINSAPPFTSIFLRIRFILIISIRKMGKNPFPDPFFCFYNVNI